MLTASYSHANTATTAVRMLVIALSITQLKGFAVSSDSRKATSAADFTDV